MTTTTPIPTYALKFILVGDVGVGKSQLARRFAKDKFDADAQSTVGMEFSTKILYIGKNIIRAQIWDAAGQERFEGMTKAYYRDAVGVMLVYDINNRESFENIKSSWLRQVRKYGGANLLVLVGTKSDEAPRRREVSRDEAVAFSRAMDIDFIETSASSGSCVETAFRRIIMSVAYALPEIRSHLDSTGLPRGWCHNYGSTNPNAASFGRPHPSATYLNYWTGETSGRKPTDSAPRGSLAANCDEERTASSLSHKLSVRKSVDLTSDKQKILSKIGLNSEALSVPATEKTSRCKGCVIS